MHQFDAKNVHVQMHQKSAMGFGMRTSQLHEISKHVIDGESLYLPITYESSEDEDDNIICKVPQELCFKNNNQLIVRNNQKDQFYILADGIIMDKIDNFIIRHY